MFSTSRPMACLAWKSEGAHSTPLSRRSAVWQGAHLLSERVVVEVLSPPFHFALTPDLNAMLFASEYGIESPPLAQQLCLC
mmetsp:Transcript_95678/g.160779  ORF Transcript_95678/g.160779 Transcript_95678/m.160779 type:complete len:81 (-) Transcript_95678:288-530(-)